MKLRAEPQAVAFSVVTCLHPGRTERKLSTYDCSSVITSHLSSFRISPSSNAESRILMISNVKSFTVPQIVPSSRYHSRSAADP